MNFSKLTQPLTSLLRKDTSWNWSDACKKAFESLKTAFLSAPILRHFDPQLPIIIETDASDYSYGAVLSQRDADSVRPVAFYSKKMSPAELNYPIYDKELLAIVSCFKEWRVYLEGSLHQIEVLTDHKNLEYFLSSKILNRRQSRWAEFISGFDFKICYVVGKSNTKADMLSRNPQHRPKVSKTPENTLLKPEHFAQPISNTSHTSPTSLTSHSAPETS